eukprot:TRINITY_DN1211_c0_g1_i1.p1 TRINITY_DN1211_c0_g1~~TRINITY_DN1211_c0_g1_i1.p1  ORF type:complete len:547 (+),score=127.91 TRINITY_DN1211_c0_g1_i1:249-1889(+)
MSLVEVLIAPKISEIDRALLLRLSDKTQTKPYEVKFIDATLRRQAFLDKKIKKAKKLGSFRVKRVISQKKNCLYDNAANMMNDLETRLNRAERRHGLFLQRIKLGCHHHNILVDISKHNCLTNGHSKIAFLKAKMLEKQIQANHNRNKIWRKKARSFEIWKIRRNQGIKQFINSNDELKMKIDSEHHHAGFKEVDEIERKREFALKDIQHVKEVLSRKKQKLLQLKKSIYVKQKASSDRREMYLSEIISKARYHNERVKYTLAELKDRKSQELRLHFEKMDKMERNYQEQLIQRASFAKRSSLRQNIIKRLNQLKTQCLYLTIMRKQAEADRRRENFLLKKCLFAKKDVRLVSYRKVLDYYRKSEQRQSLNKRMERAFNHRKRYLEKTLEFAKKRDIRAHKLLLKLQNNCDLLNSRISCNLKNAAQRRRIAFSERSLFAIKDLRRVEENKHKVYLNQLNKLSKLHTKLEKASLEYEMNLLSTSEKAKRMSLRSAPNSPESFNYEIEDKKNIALSKINEKLEAASKRRDKYLKSRISHVKTLSSPRI